MEAEIDARIIAAHDCIVHARYQKLATEKPDFGNSAEWGTSDALVAEKRLSHAGVLDAGGLNNTNYNIMTARIGYK
jgi:hypothetical protein